MNRLVHHVTDGRLAQATAVFDAKQASMLGIAAAHVTATVEFIEAAKSTIEV